MTSINPVAKIERFLANNASGTVMRQTRMASRGARDPRQYRDGRR